MHVSPVSSSSPIISDIHAGVLDTIEARAFSAAAAEAAIALAFALDAAELAVPAGAAGAPAAADDAPLPACWRGGEGWG